MYESPIEIIISDVMNEIERKQDEQIIRAVKKVDIDVNEKELRKALIYDRQQYNKGYRDGIREFAERLKEALPMECRTVVEGNDMEGITDTGFQKDDTMTTIDNLVKEMAGDTE